MTTNEHWDDDAIGTPMGPSRWFRGPVNITKEEVKTFVVRWICPVDLCGGEMLPNGLVWPTNPPGIHHTCNKCGYTAAVRDRYPKQVTERIAQT